MNADDVLKRYVDEWLPEFVEMSLTDINQHGHTGDTPLHVASVRGKREEFDPLVAAGAEINAKGDLGHLPIHYAIKFGHVEIVKKLLECGADLNYKNEFDESAVDLINSSNNKEMMSLLS